MIQVNIAVQFHRVDVAQKLIDALNEQTVKPSLIVIILQGFIHGFESPNVPCKYITNDSNKGAFERFKHLGDNINLIIDDDFITATNYIETAYAGLKRNPDAFCSFWGFKFVKPDNYSEGWANIESWFHLPCDVRCIKIGCGLSIWDESKLKLGKMKFDNVNFNDMQLAVHCTKNHIPMYAIAHDENIAQHIGDYEIQANAIYKTGQSNIDYLNAKHQELINIFVLN